MTTPAKIPGRYGLYSTYDKRRAAKNELAGARKQVPSLLKSITESRNKIHESRQNFKNYDDWTYTSTKTGCGIEVQMSGNCQAVDRLHNNKICGEFSMRNGNGWFDDSLVSQDTKDRYKQLNESEDKRLEVLGEVVRLLKSEGSRYSKWDNNFEQNGKYITMSVRDWGNWVIPDGEHDDGDYDWKTLDYSSRTKLSSVIGEVAKKFPQYEITYSISEKNWMTINVTKK